MEYRQVDKPSTVRDLVALSSPERPIRMHHIARALGVTHMRAEEILTQNVTPKVVFSLHQLAQYKLMALTDRLWPHAPWFRGVMDEAHPVVHLIRHTFGRWLLKYAVDTYGEESVLKYWGGVSIPDAFSDLPSVSEEEDVLDLIPDEQVVLNPHIPEEEVGELFAFGTVEAARLFAWLIANRSNFSHYVHNWTGFINDLYGVQLAYELREALGQHYWAPLPPDTLSAYLRIAHSLQMISMPDAYYEGALSQVEVVKVATMHTPVLCIVQSDDERLWRNVEDILYFSGQPVHLYLLVTEAVGQPVGLIITPKEEPPSPEVYRQEGVRWELTDSDTTDDLVFVSLKRAAAGLGLDEVADLLDSIDIEELHGLKQDGEIFYLCLFDEYGGARNLSPIEVYTHPDGFLLQFAPEYTFHPSEMYVNDRSQ
jgi:hypothetical protein